MIVDLDDPQPGRRLLEERRREQRADHCVGVVDVGASSGVGSAHHSIEAARARTELNHREVMPSRLEREVGEVGTLGPSVIQSRPRHWPAPPPKRGVRVRQGRSQHLQTRSGRRHENAPVMEV